MFCMNCGTKLPDGAKFCMNCGTKVGSLDAAPAPTPAPKTRPTVKKESVELQARYERNFLYAPGTGIYLIENNALLFFHTYDSEKKVLIPKTEGVSLSNLCYWEENVYCIAVYTPEGSFSQTPYLCKIRPEDGTVTKTEIRNDGTVNCPSYYVVSNAQLWNGALWFFNIFNDSVCSISLSNGRLSGKKLPEGVFGNGDLFVHDGYGYTGLEDGGVRFKLRDPDKLQRLDKLDRAFFSKDLNSRGFDKLVAVYKNRLYYVPRLDDRIGVTPMEKDWAGATRCIDMPKFARLEIWLRLGSHLVNSRAVFDLDTEEFTRAPKDLLNLRHITDDSGKPYFDIDNHFDYYRDFQEMPDGSVYYFYYYDHSLEVHHLPADAWETGEYEMVLDVDTGDPEEDDVILF